MSNERYTIKYTGKGVILLRGVGLFKHGNRACVCHEIAKMLIGTPDWEIVDSDGNPSCPGGPRMADDPCPGLMRMD